MKKDNAITFAILAISFIVFLFWGFNYINNFSSHHVILFLLASIFGIFMACNIGGNDVANSFGTSVGAKTLTLKQALIVAAVFECSGAIFAGGEVTETIRNGIVSVSDDTMPMFLVFVMLAALIASGLWIFLATKKALPVSTTHSIVGGIVGASLTMGLLDKQIKAMSMVNWDGIFMIALSWVISPLLGGVLAYVIFAYIHKKIIKPSEELNKTLKILKIQKKEFKKQFLLELNTKNKEEQIKELSNIILDDEDKSNSFYKSKLKELKEKEKELNIFSNFNTHVPIIGCVSAIIITAMLLLKGLKEVSSFTLTQGLWIMFVIGALAYLITLAITRIIKKTNLNKTINRMFAWFQIFTASAFAFSHGANDISNAIGPFAAILDILKNNAINTASPVPSIAMIMFGIALAAGLYLMGKEVITTVGSKLAEIKPTTGFSAELGASAVILFATQFGIPVSSTHILIGAILGIGLYNHKANFKLMKPIALAWVITLPVTALLASIFFIILRLIFVL